LGVLQNNTVIVHGVGLQEKEIAMLEKAGAGLIWCPVSNLRLYGQTAPIAQLRGRLRLALGTDAALTGAPTLFDELRAALATGLATAEELLEMVTTSAANILKLPDAGTLRAGALADVIVLPDAGTTPAATLLQSHSADLKMVIIGGEIHLAEPNVFAIEANAMIDGRPKFLEGCVDRLQRRILKHFRANAAEIAATPLWQILQAPKIIQEV